MNEEEKQIIRAEMLMDDDHFNASGFRVDAKLLAKVLTAKYIAGDCNIILPHNFVRWRKKLLNRFKTK